MKVLIDTNIVIDILEQREPFFESSYRVMQLGLEGQFEAYISASAVTDVYYIINQSLRDSVKAREKIFALTTLMAIYSTTPDDIRNALAIFVNDFEDAVMAATAKREKTDYIITRNSSDFANSPIPAISPSDFLSKYEPVR